MTPLQEWRTVLRIARRKFAELGVEGYYEWLETLDDDLYGQFHAAASDPALSLRPEQELPDGDWYIQLYRTGRGWGKNHAASCAINQLVEFEFPGKQGLIVGATFKDVRSTIFEGPSGLKNTARPGMEPVFSEHKAEIRWPNGSTAIVRTGDNPQDIRGASVPWAYADELIKWPKGEVSFSNIQNCVRETDRPRIILTSTPLRGAEWLKRIEEREDCIVTTGKSSENKFLPKAFFVGQNTLNAKNFEEEANGEWVSDSGSLWSRDQLDAVTLKDVKVELKAFAETLDERAVSIDPSGGKRDLTGIILLGVQGDTKWVLDDLTLKEPVKQATWIAELKTILPRYLKPGDRIIVETNGSSGLDETLQEHFPDYYVERIYHAGKDTKIVRAEKAQVLYEQRLVRHFRPLPRLEQQMIEFYDVVASTYESPDRADALVTGLNHLHESAAPSHEIATMGMSTSFRF